MRALALLLLFFVPRSFEVASVKPAQAGVPPAVTLDAAHFSCSGVTLLGLMFSAWRVPAWRITGAPSWVSSDLWDIAATMPSDMPKDRQELMHETDLLIQQLIEDRFHLVMHRESREQSAFALTVARGGLKLKPSEAPSFSSHPRPGHIELRRASIASLVSALFTPQAAGAQPLDRPVVDMTGLTGLYDVVVDWSDGASVLTALEEQAGLKVEARKLPLEFLVIDHVEKPTAN